MNEEQRVGLEKMREPFPSNQINIKPQPFNKDSAKGECRVCGGYHGLPALHPEFVGHAALTDRLLDIDLDWDWEPFALDEDGLPKFDSYGGLWIWLTVCGKRRIGYGDAGGKKGGNAIKEAIGDAMRNAGMRYGAALELWHKGDLHANVDTDDDSDDDSESPTPQMDPAVAARVELNYLLQSLKKSPDDAALRFKADGNGDLGRSTDVDAIKALTKFYADQAAEA